ncbi:hypothetical protein ACP70R_034104 [Stipagrostis hirtigluma subsp. patula]
MDPPQDAPPPPDDKLISLFLRRKVAGEPLPAAAAELLHDADIYAAEPATLTAGIRPAPARKGEGSSWFFFTRVSPKSSKDSRKSRRVGGGVGTWHSEHAPRDVVDGEGNRVGHSQLFSYQRKIGRKSERTGWYMLEFGGADQEADREGGGGGDPVLVLCKIYKARSRSRRADGFAWKPSLIDSERKMKTPEDGVDQAPAPVRRRLFGPSQPTPPAAAHDKISATSEPTPCFLMPEPEEVPPSETATSDYCSFPVAGDATPAPEYCYNSYVPEIPRCAGSSGGSWIGGNLATASCFGEMGFLGGVDTYDKQPETSQGNATELDWSFLQAGGTAPAPELCFGTNPVDVGDMSGIPLLAPGAASSASSSWVHGDTTASCSGSNTFLGRGLTVNNAWSLPVSYEWGVDGGATQYACGLPSAPVQPLTMGSWWCGGPEVWSF